MLDFTGERFIPTEGGEIRYEHMHRYCWAQSLCTGRTVLDIACGEGYGSAVLAKVAESVIGVDISQDAVDHASRNYAGYANLRFAQGSATRIPVDNASMDVAVSFETLEHLADQEEMLAELRRVLKPSGLLVISSPNKKVYSDERDYVNEFHVKELYFDEFDALLHRHFGATSHFGQRFLTASALLPLVGPANRYDALLLEGDEAQARTFMSDQSMYFVAVCAAGADLLPTFTPNLFIESGADLYAGQQHVMRWASRLDNEHQELSARYIGLQSEFDERGAWAMKLSAGRDEMVRESVQLRQQLDDIAGRTQFELTEATAAAAATRRQLAAMINSRSWKLTAPLRWLGRLLTSRDE
jgi:ubiquinone/menaquinone biosynthesis C-methylase UbiE